MEKNHIYTIIEYDDGYDIQKIVLDFEKGASYAQSIIYKKMLECRKTAESKKPESDTSSHSPIRNIAEIKNLRVTQAHIVQYGFKMLRLL